LKCHQCLKVKPQLLASTEKHLRIVLLWSMRLALVLRAEAVGLTMTGEAAGLAEEDKEDIKLSLHLFLLKTHKIYS